jgi:hypothetical protein
MTGFTSITTRLSPCQYYDYIVVVQSAEPITGPPWGRVRGQILIAQEHQPLPSEPGMHDFHAPGSHEITYVSLKDMGYMPGQKGASRRIRRDESFDDMVYRLGVACD